MNPQVEELLERFKEAKNDCLMAAQTRDNIAFLLAEAVSSAPPEEPAPPPKKKPRKKAPPGGRKTNVERAAKEYADYEPAASGCLCGCGEDCNGSFVRGHHHRLNAIVAAVDAGSLPFNTISPHAWYHVRSHADSSEHMKERCVEAIRDQSCEVIEE